MIRNTDKIRSIRLHGTFEFFERDPPFRQPDADAAGGDNMSLRGARLRCGKGSLGKTLRNFQRLGFARWRVSCASEISVPRGHA